MFRASISNLLWKITVVVVICSCGVPAHAKYGGGTGEPNDPYFIYTAEQMNEIGLIVNWDDLDKHFKLVADIDLGQFTGEEFNIIGTSNPELPFSGVFDGNGHTISNFTYTTTDTDNIGLFGYVDVWEGNAEIKNLGLIDPNVDAGTGNNVGSLIGYNSGNITNCHVKGGSVSVDGIDGEGGNNVGSLVGYNNGNITNCYAEGGSVSGNDAVGGLVGGSYYDQMMARYGTIANCYSTGSVSGTNQVGGLVGCNISTITNCYSTGEIQSEYGLYVGGLVGGNYVIITNCY
jgi:hypothetical protein